MAGRRRRERLGRPRPYLMGPVRDAFDAWLEATRARYLPPLELREVRKGVQALSSLYVERRAGADLAARALEGRGKRAALATYYGPLHFLATWHAIAAIGPARFGAVRRVFDLGCGTGAAGAAAALALAREPAEPRSPAAPDVVALDRSGFALGEARACHAAFGLAGRTRRGRLPAALPALREGDLVVLGWVVNELAELARRALLARLDAAVAVGVRLLLLEPLAGPASPWWNAWRDVLAPHGVESRITKVRIARPEWIARLDRAAGLDHAVLGTRVLAGPLVPRDEEPALAEEAA